MWKLQRFLSSPVLISEEAWGSCIMQCYIWSNILKRKWNVCPNRILLQEEFFMTKTYGIHCLRNTKSIELTVINTSENWATWMVLAFDCRNLIWKNCYSCNTSVCITDVTNRGFLGCATVYPKQCWFFKKHLMTKNFTLSLTKKRHHMPRNKMLRTLHALYVTWAFASF